MKKITVYESEDCNLFRSAKDCARYDGLVVCSVCNGTGQISYERNVYPSGLPDSGWVTEMKTFYEKCRKCSGLGYVKLVEKVDIDPEYEEYLRLKEKFGTK